MCPDDDIDLSELAGDDTKPTEQLSTLAPAAVRKFRVVVAEGPGKGEPISSTGERLSIGSHPSNDLVLEDPAVSRFHCEIRLESGSAWLVDLDSRNGTVLDGVPVGRGGLRDGSTVQLGRSACRFEFEATTNLLPVSDKHQLGSLVGRSVAMRSCFALVERTARTDATVLIEGETGTGKEGIAEAIHLESSRRDAPFLVIDCGAVPPNLIESELFGHEKGAFTGAVATRPGVFEEARGGTVLLDEIGELPIELQPKLLGVLERRQIRPIGSSTHKNVDVRMVAATHRDLRALVNEGSFRPDLYYRLAVVQIRVPPLRARPDDIPVLTTHFLQQLAADEETVASLSSHEAMARLQRAVWPGNVRELRNYLERCVVMQQPLPTAVADPADGLAVDASLSYSEAKRKLLDVFERQYLTALLSRHQGNVSQAARAAGMDRVYVYKLLHRHGLKLRR